MPDWPTWVQAAAAIVQAAAAVVIVRLTVRLAKANDALANATNSYAQSAREQVSELVRARLALVQPYVEVVQCSIGGRVDPYLQGLEIGVELRNMGAGPALSLRSRLDHPRLGFKAQAQSVTIPPGETAPVTFTVQTSSTDPSGIAMPKSMLLLIEYRDVAGRWWESTMPLTLGYTREANGTYQSPGVAVEDQQTAIRPIDQPSINGSLGPSRVLRRFNMTQLPLVDDDALWAVP